MNSSSSTPAFYKSGFLERWKTKSALALASVVNIVEHGVCLSGLSNSNIFHAEKAIVQILMLLLDITNKGNKDSWVFGLPPLENTQYNCVNDQSMLKCNEHTNQLLIFIVWLTSFQLPIQPSFSSTMVNCNSDSSCGNLSGKSEPEILMRIDSDTISLASPFIREDYEDVGTGVSIHHSIEIS